MVAKIFTVLMLLVAVSVGAIETEYIGAEPNGYWDANNWTLGPPTNPFLGVLISEDLIVPTEATMVGIYVELGYDVSLQVLGRIETMQYVDLYYSDVFLVGGGSIEFVNTGAWTLGFTGDGVVNVQHGRISGLGVINGDENVTFYFDQSFISGENWTPGDIDGRGHVNFADLAILVENWLQ
ncbi:hypothetical protein LCGC14_0476070 [marine sediment metagenome]|uniref:Uncharacterized protein n=1 Tax=marine sediment metagenome TaxID=412755 RepID=A0A0F9SAU1_9ZZZZ